MQRKQVVCVSAVQPRLQLSVWRSIFLGALLVFLVLGTAAATSAQVNTATLSGTVFDPQNLGVKGARVTLTNAATGATRTAVTDDNGRYNLVGIPPGRYKMTVDGGSSFGRYENPSVVLTVGENASFDLRLELKGMQQIVTVSAETAPIETTKTEVSDTVEQRRIDNLPINGRNYINFTLTNSQTTRDMAPTIGPAPNSGLSIGGARARGEEEQPHHGRPMAQLGRDRKGDRPSGVSIVPHAPRRVLASRLAGQQGRAERQHRQRERQQQERLQRRASERPLRRHRYRQARHGVTSAVGRLRTVAPGLPGFLKRAGHAANP